MDKGSNISSTPLTTSEIATLLKVAAEEYKTTIPSLLAKLDAVSGDLNALHQLLSGDKSVEWTKDEDDLMSKNPELLKRWKGVEAVELRKKYLSHKAK